MKIHPGSFAPYRAVSVLRRAWGISLLLAVLLSSCATSGTAYWIPPRSSPTSEPETARLAEPTPTTQTGTGGAGSALSALDQVSTQLAPETTPTSPLISPTAESATPAPEPTEIAPPPEPDPLIAPSATPPEQAGPPETNPVLYYAQAADTLRTTAIRFGVAPDEITSPEPIPENEFINPGQLLIIPRRLMNTTSSEQLIPDSEVVFSPSAIDFDATAFAEAAGGRLGSYKEFLKSSGMTSGADVVMRVALENSINPRLLMALLEYESGIVYGFPASPTAEKYPMGVVDPRHEGLYRQLVWAVNQLSIGYYAYREGRLTQVQFKDGLTIRLAPDLNAGTAALQYYFAQSRQGLEWMGALDSDNGFPALHRRMYGDPWGRSRTIEPLFPPGITQPPLILPFMRNWLWSYTGGPHGAWEHDGAYAALDFAPGSIETGCGTSSTYTVAAASGLVVRTGPGVVVLDLDGDGYEQTGWVITYLHISVDGRIPVGEWVDVGDQLGHPSCEGGFSTGTHVHIARKYNGEWIPADGPLPFNLSGWIAQAGEDAYLGTLTRGNEVVTACTCASYITRIIRTDEDP